MHEEKFVWGYTGQFRKQHDPKMIGPTTMMFFDNLGHYPWSRVAEINPITKKEIWSFQGSINFPFFTETCGSAYRLNNGNTLIIESDNGRAIEITPNKEIVWEFVNPYRAGPENNLIATLCDMVRIPKSYVENWLDI